MTRSKRAGRAALPLETKSRERQNTLKIAVIEEQVGALRVQQNRMEAKLDALASVIDRGKGAYAASLVLAGLIGGFVLKLLLPLFSLVQR